MSNGKNIYNTIRETTIDRPNIDGQENKDVLQGTNQNANSTAKCNRWWN